MSGKLTGKRIAILVADGFEQVEMTRPKEALEAEGADTFIVSPNPGEIRGVNHAEEGDRFGVDIPLDMWQTGEYDALLIPGGLMNPDELRSTDAALEFVRHFFSTGKPVAAICHAAWVLIDAGVVAGRTLTSWPAIRTDVRNAGGHWVDQEVVVDGGLVTSRRPDDIPAFNEAMIRAFANALPASERETASLVP